MSESAWVDSDIKEWITDEDTPISGCLFGPCGLTYEIADQGAKGNAVISTGNQFTYTPDPDENGSDAFTYRVRDLLESIRLRQNSGLRQVMPLLLLFTGRAVSSPPPNTH